MEFLAIILAAGKGSRLKSNVAKPLHKVAGSAMISWVSAAAEAAGAVLRQSARDQAPGEPQRQLRGLYCRKRLSRTPRGSDR